MPPVGPPANSVTRLMVASLALLHRPHWSSLSGDPAACATPRVIPPDTSVGLWDPQSPADTACVTCSHTPRLTRTQIPQALGSAHIQSLTTSRHGITTVQPCRGPTGVPASTLASVGAEITL